MSCLKISNYFQKEAAESSGWDLVWLKNLAIELASEDNSKSIFSPCLPFAKFDVPSAVQKPIRLTIDAADRVLIARLELDAQGMS